MNNDKPQFWDGIDRRNRTAQPQPRTNEFAEFLAFESAWRPTDLNSVLNEGGLHLHGYARDRRR